MDNSSESSRYQVNEFPANLNDRYDIERKIGQGGFAQTFLAKDRKTGKQCVLKVLSWKDIDDWKTIELFEREARVLSQIDHPQIPRFIEFFTHQEESETKIVLVQEYITGKNLAQLIHEGKRYTEKEVIRLAVDATQILEYLHNFSPPIIHRDIKSTNLLLSETGELHLVDFGAVRDKVLHHQKSEAGGFTVVGTYGFMPFEQFQGQAVPASDIYSLGMTLVHVLSHREPHEMELTGSDFTPYINVSKNFEYVLKKMTAHQVADRYATAKELREDLEALLLGKEPKIEHKNRWKISSGTLVVLLLILFVGWFAIVRKTPVARPKPAPVTEIPAKPALRPPYSGRSVRGNVQFDGKPVTQVTKVHPTAWFRDESKGIIVTAELFYSDGEFEIRGLTPGHYGVSMNFDSNQNNPQSFPGDLRAWQTFTVVDEADTAMNISVKRLIHLIKPDDNGRVLPYWNRCCEEGKPRHSQALELQWSSLGENVFYDYTISRLICPYKTVGSVASGTTDQTRVKLNLPPTQSNEYYLLQIDARKDGKEIGMLMTHGANGHGWDYRFRIE
jgi:serine/threonine protein kinase